MCRPYSFSYDYAPALYDIRISFTVLVDGRWLVHQFGRIVDDLAVPDDLGKRKTAPLAKHCVHSDND
jgi:hypothetical protein